MTTRPCFIVLMAVLLQAAIPAHDQSAPAARGPLLPVDGDTAASPLRPSPEIVRETTRGTSSPGTADNGPASQLAEIVVTVQALLVRTSRLLLEASVLCLRFLARIGAFQT